MHRVGGVQALRYARSMLPSPQPEVPAHCFTRVQALRHVQDPLADAVAEEMLQDHLGWPDVEGALDHPPQGEGPLQRLAVEWWTPPVWADPERTRLGARVLQRTGILGGVVLALYSLPLGYRSPTATKPLVFSGRLVDQAPRRLAETNRFLHEVTRPGGIEVGAQGWRIAARVRVVHALVRARIRRAPERWDSDAWGAPINQTQMAGTNLLFGLHGLVGLRHLGARYTHEEVQAVLHLWRRVGVHLGQLPELLCSTEAEAWQLWHAVEAGEGPPDDDGRALAKALIEHAVPHTLSRLIPGEADLQRRALVPLCYQLSTALLGQQHARSLGYPRTRLSLAIPTLSQQLLGQLEGLRVRTPLATRIAAALGQALNDRLAEEAMKEVAS